jgi:hypothetical protein
MNAIGNELITLAFYFLTCKIEKSYFCELLGGFCELFGCQKSARNIIDTELMLTIISCQFLW